MKGQREPGTTRRHVYLYDSDWEYLETYYGHSIGISKAARVLLHSSIEKLKAKANATAKPVSIEPSLGSFASELDGAIQPGPGGSLPAGHSPDSDGVA